MPYGTTSVSERRTLPPAVAVSVVAFALQPPSDAERDDAALTARRAPAIWLPLVRRTRAPFLGQWALPGGPTEWDETLTDTAERTLRGAVRRDPGSLEQLYSFGGVERSADAQRLVTIAYWALYGERELAAPASTAGADPDPEPRSPLAHAPRRWDDPAPDPALAPSPALRSAGRRAADEAAASGNVRWFTADALPELAFDHAEIVAYALARLRARTEYAAVAYRFLGSEFTLSQLREVTEAVLGEPIDPANFRRQALARGGLRDTGRRTSGGAHRPARLYRFSEADGDDAPQTTPLFTHTPTRSSA